MQLLLKTFFIRRAAKERLFCHINGDDILVPLNIMSRDNSQTFFEIQPQQNVKYKTNFHHQHIHLMELLKVFFILSDSCSCRSNTDKRRFEIHETNSRNTFPR